MTGNNNKNLKKALKKNKAFTDMEIRMHPVEHQIFLSKYICTNIIIAHYLDMQF